MAIRQIRTQGDSILTKECRKVEKMTPKIQELIHDMFDTMYEAFGVGLAGPQVGMLKQIVVIDTTGDDPYVLINPEIMETSGSQTGDEGCSPVGRKQGCMDINTSIFRHFQNFLTDNLSKGSNYHNIWF